MRPTDVTILAHSVSLPEPDTQGQGHTVDRKALRKEKNRASAAASRARREAYTASLEEEVCALGPSHSNACHLRTASCTTTGAEQKLAIILSCASAAHLNAFEVIKLPGPCATISGSKLPAVALGGQLVANSPLPAGISVAHT